MQLSAFFPFYRNHNTLSADSQEAYGKRTLCNTQTSPPLTKRITLVWASVAEASKTAMRIRYSLLPYMYTLFYLAHTTGSTVMRALSWEFPTDPTLAPIDNQFLLGPSLMVIPALGQGMTEVHGIFPGVARREVWYDWYTQTAVEAQPGMNKTIPAPLGHIPVYVRGGSCLPRQEAMYTTRESRETDWSLLCALDKDGAATGQLYVDDGESVVPPAELLVDFTAAGGSLYASSRGLYEDMHPLANVTVMGVPEKPSSVMLNGVDVGGCVFYDGGKKVLSLTGLQGFTKGGAWAEDWVLSWA